MPRALPSPTPSSPAGIAESPGAPTADARSREISPPLIPDYALLHSIGRGAYGEVWLAQDVIGTYHAVKVVFRSNFKDLVPFEREFRGIQKFTPISRSHPGFVHILHVGYNQEAGYFYYIMELGDDLNTGQTVHPDQYIPKNLARELSRRGRWSARECVQLGLDLTVALDHLHQHQLIHRDIKPSNIIFVNHKPKFADIGLVTDIVEGGDHATYLGTQGYIAPEGPGHPASDVYSLGKVLYEATTGLDRTRFPELPTSLVDAAASERVFQLNKIILKACENDVSKRYPTAQAMHADLFHLQVAGAPRRHTRFWQRRHHPDPP